MTIILTGLNKYRDVMKALHTHGELGTDGTASAESDTDLIAGDSGSIYALTVTSSDKQFNTSFTLPSTGGTTSCTFKEYKEYDNSSSTNLSRIVFTGLAFTKNGSEEITVVKRYFVRAV